MMDEEKARQKARLRTAEKLAQLAREEEPHIDPSECMKTLHRRLEFLDKKIRDRDASEAAMAYHRNERHALRWAILKLEGVLVTERAARLAQPPQRGEPEHA